LSASKENVPTDRNNATDESRQCIKEALAKWFRKNPLAAFSRWKFMIIAENKKDSSGMTVFLLQSSINS
jgi:hypothetical protein